MRRGGGACTAPGDPKIGSCQLLTGPRLIFFSHAFFCKQPLWKHLFDQTYKHSLSIGVRSWAAGVYPGCQERSIPNACQNLPKLTRCIEQNFDGAENPSDHAKLAKYPVNGPKCILTGKKKFNLVELPGGTTVVFPHPGYQPNCDQKCRLFQQTFQIPV